MAWCVHRVPVLTAPKVGIRWVVPDDLMASAQVEFAFALFSVIDQVFREKRQTSPLQAEGAGIGEKSLT
ncbi:hypothetical protein AXG93_4343s1340 [Marchantia polymorpha subsp. ruderalis]|uniref:Uncharacterized protein n=1 Tax=Marchantia polymorpha subsp. ruderalis TaxID=1480154 RepID=A0A176VUD8_MARPO|nr:hypothetical protein AXG93_4343s1340 [Marchantia polymorpha subsp. ruderalis]